MNITYHDCVPILESFKKLSTNEIKTLMESTPVCQTPLFKAMAYTYVEESNTNPAWEDLSDYLEEQLEDFDITQLQSYFDKPLAKSHCLTVARLADLILNLNKVCLVINSPGVVFQDYYHKNIPLTTINTSNGIISTLEISKIGTTLYTSALDISLTREGTYKLWEFIDIPYRERLTPNWAARFYDYALKYDAEKYKNLLQSADVNLQEVSIEWLARLIRTDKLDDPSESGIIFNALEHLTGYPKQLLRDQTILLTELMSNKHNKEIAALVHVNCSTSNAIYASADLPDLNLQY